ncbi:uncharacterized protein LOC141708095 [Apium graveolens]|uniref:uncharacterized protein LOC141708095 n=1 Tax=Apium graveolens TaxID=4045 RepID=UPI003D7927E6
MLFDQSNGLATSKETEVKEMNQSNGSKFRKDIATSMNGKYLGPKKASVQPGYSQPPPSQAGYAQPDSGAQRVATAGYSVTRASSYAPPPYDAPLVTQSSYGQPPIAYNNILFKLPRLLHHCCQTSHQATQAPPPLLSDKPSEHFVRGE